HRGALAAGALVFAGPGNNGGDAWVVAAALAQSGVRVRVHEPLPSAAEDARAERDLAMPFVEPVDDPGAAYQGEGVVIDGLLGTGSSGAPRGPLMAAISAMRVARERKAIVVAIDLPTGLDATTGETHKPVPANLTVTYGTLKRGHLLARAACGRVVVVDIGLGRFAWGAGEDDAPRVVSGSWVAARLPDVPPDAHKGTRKKIAIVGGGAGMSGAAILAARAAWRSGVGMVKLVVAEESLGAVRDAEPQSLTAPWPRTEAAAKSDISTWADCVVIGPGLGGGIIAREIVQRVLESFEGPVVIDADAINAFNADVNALARLLHGRPAVLTPHPAEFGRLAGVAVDDVLARRFDIAATVARHTAAVVLLKGQPTVITGPSGERLVSASGTPLLAAAGSGDLLTGMVATLLAQTGDATVAAACAAYVHGRAAWLAQRGRSIRGLSLDDVMATLPAAWNPPSGPSRYPVLFELPDLTPRPRR
ncbi:MAG: NAD(P)H-hydrate dehydratase, partial [Gemmatimonadaceae bacterium]